MSLDKVIREEARLIILKELAAQPNYSLNESLLQVVLETFGIARPRAWVREEMNFLQSQGAITTTEIGTVFIGTLTDKGREHVEGRYLIQGIKRPGPRV
jgi:hypothetical protein